MDINNKQSLEVFDTLGFPKEAFHVNVIAQGPANQELPTAILPANDTPPTIVPST